MMELVTCSAVSQVLPNKSKIFNPKPMLPTVVDILSVLALQIRQKTEKY